MPLPFSSRSLMVAAIVCLLAILTGCRDKNVITQAECVGTYEYRSQGRPTGTACFTLRSDRTYVLGASQGQQDGLAFFRLHPTGFWHVNDDAKRQQIFIDRVTLPIARVNGTMRLRMSTDYDISCDLIPASNRPA
jgi:hypothetical protein